MPSPNRKLPSEEELRHMVACGIGRGEIARRYGCGHNTVRTRFRELRIVAPFKSVHRVDPANLPKVSVARASGPVSLPAISMFLAALEQKP